MDGLFKPAARLQQPVTGLTQRALVDLLLLHDISPSLAARVHGHLTQCEVGRYAPFGAALDGSELLDETQWLIDDLEQHLDVD